MKKRYYFFIAFLILFFMFFLINTKYGLQNVKKNTRYIDSLNISLKGKILDIKKLDRGAGLILLSPINSNYKQFDGRSRVQYFLVVKNNKAEIYIPNIDNMQINDSMVIEKRNILIYRKTDLILFLENGVG